MSADQTLDPGALERLLEITGGDLDFVDELVDTFIDDAGTQLDALDAAVASANSAALVRPAHSLKSNADNVGAVTLRDLSRGLEADGKAGDVPDAAGRVAAIRAEFDAVHAALLDARANR